MKHRLAQWTLAALALAALSAPAFADRTVTYSLSRLHCVECGDDIGRSIKKVKGVKKYSFDYLKAEATVVMLDDVTDARIVKAIEAAGYGGEPGAGKGKYMDFEPYGANVDFAFINKDGSTMGPLDSLRVPGKFTVFDIYAEWCMPCRQVDMELHRLLEKRTDVAVRRVNFVSWESPLAKQMDGQVKALPHLVIFTPDGKSNVVEGFNAKKLKDALTAK